MRNISKFLFWIIIIVTVLATIVVLPESLHVKYTSPTIPLVNQKISIDRTFVNIHNIAIGSFRFNRDLSFKKGLDLAGGTSITLKADMKDVAENQRSSALESAKAVIERRVNFLGVSEPVIQTATTTNDYRIIVELPGVTDVTEAVTLIGTTAQLTFWEEGATDAAQLVPEENLPEGAIAALGPNPKQTNLTGKDLQQATVVFDPTTGEPQVQLMFTPEGGKKFADLTKKNLNKRLAFALDNIVIQAPLVNQVIVGGNAVIQGGFTTEQARAVSIQLNAGALPVPLAILEQRTVGATLGEASLQKSLFAGVVGFLVIVIFMVVLYGRLGVIASMALVLYTLFLLAFFKLFAVTLTLAGIAGFILSIGMAVDANILIFERIREELRRGKPKEVAIELGFQRAWTSIRDSNISSIITAMILMYFGTGIVRGFAVVLFLGVVVSMFSAITVTKTFVRMIYK